MAKIQQTVWSCDGSCGVTVTNTGELPDGWLNSNFHADINFSHGGTIDIDEGRTFHAVSPCLTDWLAEMATEVGLSANAS